MEPVLSAEMRSELLDALGESQRIGMLGDSSLSEVIERSLGFVRQIPDGTATIIDLGSGGGDPGLVIAAACPNLSVTLVDRRAKRTDLLVRLVGRLGLTTHIEVLEADVAAIPQLFPGRSWDLATSRGFGTPQYTARHAAGVVRPGGTLLVSEPPSSNGARWGDAAVVETGFVLESVQFGVARLVKTAGI